MARRPAWEDVEAAKARTAEMMDACEYLQAARCKVAKAAAKHDKTVRHAVRHPHAGCENVVGALSSLRPELVGLMDHQRELMASQSTALQHLGRLTELIIGQELKFGGLEAAEAAAASTRRSARDLGAPLGLQERLPAARRPPSPEAAAVPGLAAARRPTSPEAAVAVGGVGSRGAPAEPAASDRCRERGIAKCRNRWDRLRLPQAVPSDVEPHCEPTEEEEEEGFEEVQASSSLSDSEKASRGEAAVGAGGTCVCGGAGGRRVPALRPRDEAPDAAAGLRATAGAAAASVRWSEASTPYGLRTLLLERAERVSGEGAMQRHRVAAALTAW